MFQEEAPEARNPLVEGEWQLIKGFMSRVPLDLSFAMEQQQLTRIGMTIQYSLMTMSRYSSSVGKLLGRS